MKTQVKTEGESANEDSSSSLSSESSSTCSSCVTQGKKRRLDLKAELDRPVELPGGNMQQGWQETKPLVKDRLSYLVNSERLSDIKFLVGSSETPIYGHKTILSSGSPYFEKLFFGPMATKEETLKIPDVDPEVFLEFVKYIYTDEFNEGMDDVDALLMLKPAKIYIVPHLASKCTELLITKLNPENVFLIYNRAIVFDEPRLAEICLRYVDRHIDNVILTEEFLEIDISTLCTLLERDNLRINECTLFKAVLRWSEAECNRQEKEVTAENQREVLGRALHLIRFPSMTRQEFSVEVVPKEILSKDEIISVFMNLCIESEEKPETPFTRKKRMFTPKLYYANRFSDVLSKVIQRGSVIGERIYASCVKFKSDKWIFIHGVGVYGISSSIPDLKFSVHVQLYNEEQAGSIPVLPGNQQGLLGSATKEGNARTYDFRMPFKIMFENPLAVVPDVVYSLRATLTVSRTASPGHGYNGGYGGFSSQQIDAYYGSKSIPDVTIECSEGIKATVSFQVPTVSLFAQPETSFVTGQIPQIIISV